MSPLAKLAWLRDEQPKVFAAAARFIGIKEYVFYRLFKRYAVDYSIASATGLFNLAELGWDDEALAVAGVVPERLSSLVPTTFHVEGLDPQLATELGIDPGTPFVIGANDGVLSNLGVNAIQPGDAYQAEMQQVVFDRLEQAGVRLAAVLEKALAAPAPLQAGMIAVP